MPNSKSSIKTKNRAANSGAFIELNLSKLNWATVSDPFRDKLKHKIMGNFQKSKFIIKLFCLCFTFALGTTTVKYQYDLFLPSVSVREVAQKRSFYDGRKVRLRAKVVSSSGIIVLSDDIDKDSSFASLTLPENYSPTSGSVQEILNEADPNLKSASVLITGKIDSHSKFQCHAPTFVIDAINIEVVSEVNVEPNNGDVKN